jgi:hypothetical protein
MPLLPTLLAQLNSPMNTTERFLTILSLSIGILTSLLIFFWRLFRVLNQLTDLPGEVNNVVKELKDLNKKTDRMADESKRTREDMLRWRITHLEDDHNLRPPQQRGRPRR